MRVTCHPDSIPNTEGLSVLHRGMPQASRGSWSISSALIGTHRKGTLESLVASFVAPSLFLFIHVPLPLYWACVPWPLLSPLRQLFSVFPAPCAPQQNGMRATCLLILSSLGQDLDSCQGVRNKGAMSESLQSIAPKLYLGNFP